MVHFQRIFEPPRDLTFNERAILTRLLEAEFPGRNELAHQLGAAKVARDCSHCPTIELDVDRRTPPAKVVRRIPIEAEARDTDGELIHLLLHVVEGYLAELEVFRFDDERIPALPGPASLAVVKLDIP